MKKSDLRTGMRVIFRNWNIICRVWLNTISGDVLVLNGQLPIFEASLDNFTEDLRNKYTYNHDIIQVFSSWGDRPIWTRTEEIEISIKVNGKYINEPLSFETAKRLGIIK